MARLYERFIRVLQKWPVDPGKPIKGLPEYLREQGKIAFDKQGEFKGNALQCERRLASLERLSRDHWSLKYPQSKQSGALGLTADQCKIALTRDCINALDSSKFAVVIAEVKALLNRVLKKKDA